MAMLSIYANETAVAPATDRQTEKAAKLAEKLGLRLTFPGDASYPLLLIITSERLELYQTDDKKLGPVFVDFTSGKSDYRRRKGGGRKQMIVRAIGLKGQFRPNVLDATAGLGRDAFVLACQGCRVVMCEQHPVLAALLQDGLDRARKNEYVSEIISKKIFFRRGHSIEIMRSLHDRDRPDAVYLDPMFPRRTKRALVKKEMQVLQLLVGEDKNSDQLLGQALKTAKKRVVVKRPASAPPLSGLQPDLIYETKKNRFDVYLIAKYKRDAEKASL